jgi:hypothetical protein
LTTFLAEEDSATSCRWRLARGVRAGNPGVLVDSRGNLLVVRVTDAAVQDRDGGVDLIRLVRALFPWIS